MARKLTKLEKFGLIAAVITGMLFFYLRHVYDPQQQALIQAREQLNRSITQFNELQAADPPFQLLRRLETRQETLAELEQELAKLDVRAGEAQAMILAQHWVLQEMERQNMRVVNVTPRGQKEKTFTWHVFTVVAEGDFRSLISFLHQLRTNATPMLVDQVSVTREASPWPLKIVLDLWILG